MFLSLHTLIVEKSSNLTFDEIQIRNLNLRWGNRQGLFIYDLLLYLSMSCVLKLIHIFDL